MTSQPEDKCVEYTGLNEAFERKYISVLGSAPPPGREHSPHRDERTRDLRGTIRLEESECTLADIDDLAFTTTSLNTEMAPEEMLQAVSDQQQLGDSHSGASNPPDAPETVGLEQELEENEHASESSDEGPHEDVSPLNSLADFATLIKSGTASKIIVLAGAGISTSAGIPDFRSPETGLYANLQKFKLPSPEAIFDINFFKHKPEPFFVLCKDLYPGKHLPTPTHYFMRLLENHGKLLRVFTQNIDTLERASGLPSQKIVEAHGSFATSRCLTCRAEMHHEKMRRLIRENAGDVVTCRYCGGLVKPDIVFFGEGLPDRFFERAEEDLPQCDLLIVIGTSLKVHPFASLVDEVPFDCPRLLVNRELVGEARHAYDDGFIFDGESRDCFYQGDADAGIDELVKALGWERELQDLMAKDHARLKREWSLEPATEQTTTDKTANLDPENKIPETGDGRVDDTLDKLAEDLEAVGLERRA